MGGKSWNWKNLNNKGHRNNWIRGVLDFILLHMKNDTLPRGKSDEKRCLYCHSTFIVHTKTFFTYHILLHVLDIFRSPPVITTWSRVLLETLTVTQLVVKLSNFYKNTSCSTVLKHYTKQSNDEPSESSTYPYIFCI